jgi:glycosyltransferase involved in cell wall biosynthesis
LFLVGDGDLRPQYEELARELGLGDKVKFLGRVNDEEKERLYRNCIFFVLPSINSGEAFGLVLTEAMAAGKAVIASNLPGVRTVCQNGINGLLVEPGDANDLVEKMGGVLENDEMRRKFGEAGRKMVEEKFNWERHTKDIFKVIS